MDPHDQPAVQHVACLPVLRGRPFLTVSRANTLAQFELVDGRFDHQYSPPPSLPPAHTLPNSTLEWWSLSKNRKLRDAQYLSAKNQSSMDGEHDGPVAAAAAAAAKAAAAAAGAGYDGSDGRGGGGQGWRSPHAREAYSLSL